MSDLPLPGPLDDFLDHPPTRPASDALREALRQRTTSLVRRRHVRVFAVAGAIAAAVLIAATIVWIGWPGAGEPLDEPPVAHREPAPAPPAVEPAMPRAVALEWKAFDATPQQKPALYRQAGDRYVEEADDLAAAVRCYGQAVRSASAQDLEIDRNDNWLVMALKADEIERRKER